MGGKSPLQSNTFKVISTYFFFKRAWQVNMFASMHMDIDANIVYILKCKYI